VPEERSLLKFGSEAQTLLWVGFFNALNGLGIVFASPPTREWWWFHRPAAAMRVGRAAPGCRGWQAAHARSSASCSGSQHLLSGVSGRWHRPPLCSSVCPLLPAGTPPLIQAILQNSGAIFSIPFSIWWLGDKKRYLSPWPLLAALLITGSVVVSILPTILDGNASAGVDGGNSVAWCMVYLCGLIPGAAYNVLQQR